MPTTATAKLKYLRIGPRKVRLVADAIRGRRALQAVEILSLLNKRAAHPVLKLLKSALANAKHNHSLEPENLRIAKLTVDGGAALKRYMPKAHGRATPVRERTSHINLVLSEIENKKKDIKKK
ncbi:50S ribosomal protein L22 [Patescibacteria group bacterium]|nr:MAG: 50S ribosomal protein L22 [Patescibacteria group bacterium]